MKRLSLLVIFMAVVLAMRSPLPVSAATPPVQVAECSLYAPFTTKVPARRLSISFRNVSESAADSVTVNVPNVGTFVEHGSFSPGTQIDYIVRDDARLASASPRQLPCSLAAAHFVDGQMWSNGI
jgi:hypothetical protein